MLGSKILKRCKARLSLARQLRQRRSLTNNNETTTLSGSSGSSLMQVDGAGDLDTEPINLDSDDNEEITTPSRSLGTSLLQADGRDNLAIDPLNLYGDNNTPSGPPGLSRQADGPGDLDVNPLNFDGPVRDYKNFINASLEAAAPDNDVPNTAGESMNERGFDVLMAFVQADVGSNGDESTTSSSNDIEHTGSGTTSIESVEIAQRVQPNEPVPNHWGSSARIVDVTDVSDPEEWPADMDSKNPSMELGTQPSSELIHPRSNYALQQAVACGSSHNVGVHYGQQSPGSMLYTNSNLFGAPGASTFASGSNAEQLPFGTWSSVASNPFMAAANPASAGQLQFLTPPQTLGRASDNPILRQAVENNRKRKHEASNAVVQSNCNTAASHPGIAAESSSSLADRHAELERPAKRSKLNKKDLEALRPKRKKNNKKGKGKGGRGGRGGRGSESESDTTPEPKRVKIQKGNFWNSLDPNSRGVRPGNFPDIDKLLNPTSDIPQATIYDSASEARADHKTDTDIEKDDTIPKTHAAKKAIVVALTNLMMDNTWAQDGKRSFGTWDNAFHPRHVLEKAAWDLLEALIRRNTQGPDLLFYEFLKFSLPPRWLSFKERLSKVMEAMIYHKAVVKHLLDPPYLHTLVEDPFGSIHRVRDNRHLNGKKAKLLQAAQAAMKKEQEEALRAQSLAQAPVVEGPASGNEEYSADDEESAGESIDLESTPTSPPLATPGLSSEKGNASTKVNGSTPKAPAAKSAVQNVIPGTFAPAGMGLDDLENLMGEPSYTAGANADAQPLFPIADPNPPFMATAPTAHTDMPGDLQDLMDTWLGDLPLIPFGAQPIHPAYVDPGNMAQGSSLQPNVQNLNGPNQGNMAPPPQSNMQTVDPRMIMAQSSLVPAGRAIQPRQHGQMQALGQDVAKPNMFDSDNSTNALGPLPDYMLPLPLIDVQKRNAGPTIIPNQQGFVDYLNTGDADSCAWIETPRPTRAAPQNPAAPPSSRPALCEPAPSELARAQGVFQDMNKARNKRKQADAGIQDDAQRRKRKQ
ncbi:hypothetical protein ASPACDRAFT_37921 [Aspergillus aculeatus ATCC 16872]|uniref:Uncharacterized protein n=1 Tax=Aspergillus aculeatus (strain ATCC 16872 / CBS 172.66 / WB 5094) TaxID=690307 RepID=A0A1L9X7F1_ASPA1|nr:uncharacterized protein ASPACDRAFT_37921 [Aspergillus aculeatus ATCC 16872]OJK04362.1 hypothetical protein ASPACDRAFT_37921 [Aspergillus aculeatus ATCC 16872]